MWLHRNSIVHGATVEENAGRIITDLQTSYAIIITNSRKILKTSYPAIIISSPTEL
jgi:hypothetical protein